VSQAATIPRMWNEKYLETCCRSALHRLVLAGAAGRPAGLKDGPCLARLDATGLAERSDERHAITPAGSLRQAQEVMKRPISTVTFRPAARWPLTSSPRQW
jgi:hypothetical protein